MTTPLVDDVLLDLDVVVEQTGVSRRTWRREIAAGRIGYLRISGSIRIPRAALEAYLAERFYPPRPEGNRQEPQTVAAVIDGIIPRKRRAR